MNLLCKFAYLLTVCTLISTIVHQAQAANKRCYICKSRGNLGDCKDPFYYNSTLDDGSKAIEERPCPSGWCGKSVQLKESESLMSTERLCLQRPPSDGIERCAETMYGEHSKTLMFMCFCQGDFCNSSNRISFDFKIVFTSLLTYLFMNCISRR